MSFEIGTASSYEDLFLKLETFLTAAGHAFGKTFTGTGTGDLINYKGKSGTVAQTITLTATSATSFSVVGSVSGSLGTATVGTPFTSAQIDFTITAGGTAYVAGDVWKINLSPKWPLTRAFNGCWVGDATNTGASGLVTHGGAARIASMKMIRPIEVKEIVYGTDTVATRTPSAFVVEWSDDGTSWTAASTFSGVTTGWAASVDRRFAVAASGAHRWWRVRMTAYNTTTVEYRYLDFTEATGAADGLANLRPWMTVQCPGNDGALTSVYHSILADDWLRASDIYGMAVVPHRAFDALFHGFNQPSREQSIAVYVPVANFAMNYWFVANGRRFISGIKVSTVYVSTYFGLMIPYARPSSYPLPWFVGGSVDTYSRRWSDTDSNQIHVWNRSSDTSNQAFVRAIDGLWKNISSHTGDSSNSGATTRWYPHWGAVRVNYVRENFGGGYPLLPFIPFVTGLGPMGEVDGGFWTSGFGNAAENIIRIDRVDHVVMQNIFRTTIGDYWALKLD